MRCPSRGEEIIRRQPLVDLVVGPQSYHKLPVLERQIKMERKELKLIFQQKTSLIFWQREPCQKSAKCIFNHTRRLR